MLIVTYTFKGGPADGKQQSVLIDEVPELVSISYVDWTPRHTEGEAIETKRVTYKVAVACRWNRSVSALCITELDWRLRGRVWVDAASGDTVDWMSPYVHEFVWHRGESV